MSIEQRFLDKVEIITESGCWVWMGAVVKSVGYGRFGMGGKGNVDYAHRASWRIFNGEIPDSMHVCHHCDVRVCVNPNHLFIGTRSDNMKDASRKGRVVLPKIHQMLRGENQPMAKLKNLQVIEIRNSHNTQDFLSRKYGVSQSVISNIISRKTYKSVL